MERVYEVSRIIGEALSEAIIEHPDFCGDSTDRAFVLLGEEFGEVATAINEETIDCQIKELSHTAAVCARFIDFLLEKKEG